MNAKVENLTQFAVTADALKLTSHEREIALALTQKLGIPLHDAALTEFLGIIKMEGMLDRLEQVVRGLKGDFQNDAQSLLTKMKEMLAHDLDAQLSKSLATIPADVSDKVDGALKTAFKSIAANVDITVKQEAARRQTFRLTQFTVIAALVVVLTGGWGYMIGRDTTSSDAAKWQALVNLPDGGKWLALAKLNDIDKALAQSCGLGERRVLAGGERCDVPLYISKPVASSTGMDAPKLAWAEWTNWLGVWGILGIGASFGFLFRSWLHRR